MPPINGTNAESAGFVRRLLSMVYEALLLTAVLFVATLPFILITHGAPTGAAKYLFKAYLMGVAGVYFTWFWTHSGQTLAMKTWRLRVVSRDGPAVSMRQGWLRYFAAWIGIGMLGLGILWALFDRDRQFLHDRIAGTRLIRVTDSSTGQRAEPHTAENKAD